MKQVIRDAALAVGLGAVSVGTFDALKPGGLFDPAPVGTEWKDRTPYEARFGPVAPIPVVQDTAALLATAAGLAAFCFAGRAKRGL